MIRYQLLLGAALIAGVAVGYFLAPSSRAAAGGEGDAVPAVSTRQITDHGEDASVKALRSRISELEKLLEEARRVKEPAESEGAAATEQAVAGGGTPEARPWNPRERMEQLKQNDPKRYSEITNRMAQWRARRQQRQAERLEFLSSIDASGFSDSVKKVHEDLQELIAHREELEGRIHDPSLSDAERGELFREMRETHGRMRELNVQERENLLRETVKAAGFDGDAAEELYLTVQEVVEATQGERGFGPPHHHGGGRPPEGAAPGAGQSRR